MRKTNNFSPGSIEIQFRAIFTPKYKPVDNMDVILEIYGMGYRPETQVQCHLDDEFMSLSIMDGEKVFEINGDRFRPGVSISNSEVGLASLSISAFILRLDLHEWNGVKDGTFGIIPACIHKDPE